MSEEQVKDVKDIMGNFYNEVVTSIKSHQLTIPQVMLVLDLIKGELLESAKKVYVNR